MQLHWGDERRLLEGWIINKLDYQQVGLSTGGWIIIRRLDYQQEVGLSSGGWIINRRLDYHQEVRLSTGGWIIIRRLDYQQEVGVCQSSFTEHGIRFIWQWTRHVGSGVERLPRRLFSPVSYCQDAQMLEHCSLQNPRPFPRDVAYWLRERSLVRDIWPPVASVLTWSSVRRPE